MSYKSGDLYKSAFFRHWTAECSTPLNVQRRHNNGASKEAHQKRKAGKNITAGATGEPKQKKSYADRKENRRKTSAKNTRTGHEFPNRSKNKQRWTIQQTSSNYKADNIIKWRRVFNIWKHRTITEKIKPEEKTFNWVNTWTNSEIGEKPTTDFSWDTKDTDLKLF